MSSAAHGFDFPTGTGSEVREPAGDDVEALRRRRPPQAPVEQPLSRPIPPIAHAPARSQGLRSDDGRAAFAVRGD